MHHHRWLLIAPVLGLLASGCRTLPPAEREGDQLFSATLHRIVSLVEPPKDAPPQTLVARYRLVEAEGVSKKIPTDQIELALQAPDHLRVALRGKGRDYELGRNGQQIWISAPEKNIALLGTPRAPRFLAAPEKKDMTHLQPLHLPWPHKRFLALHRLMRVTRLPDETVADARCYVLSATRRSNVPFASHLPAGRFKFWVRQSDMLPLRVNYAAEPDVRVTLEAQELRLEPSWPDERWRFAADNDDKTKIVAPSHLTHFLRSTWARLNEHLPTLGPPDGERRVVATAGRGRLEMIDGTKVLFLKGTPEEMGREHGELLRPQIRRTVERVLYGIGVGASLDNGSWFFGQMEQADQRLRPFVDARYLREMDAMAAAAGVEKEEMRLANLFPELFHCSGFALYGDATVGGTLYHGRILDYFRGMGLEQNAVVVVFQPERGNAWVNVGYAGFIGSVTAMNEKRVAIGEMGGRGEGQWDGKPMAQLVRDVMEQANTIDEAVEILRRGPRTCEYYYVVSDGKTKRAVAIRATPTEFETAWAGEAHPLIPDPIKDAVVISGDERYTELVRRIKAGYGKIDAEAARELMRRPVCAESNLHSALFAPETLDFWVANADSQNVASHARFTHYNLGELLKRAVQRRDAGKPYGLTSLKN